LWQVVRWSPLADLVSIFADASYVVSNFNKGRQHCLSHVSHAFLWGAIFDRVEELSGLGVVVVVAKVNAHNEGGINSENADRTFGNIVADSLADAAAEFFVERNMNTASCEFEVLTGLDSTATLIISRLTHIGLQFARELGRRRSKKRAVSGPSARPRGFCA
jgi:hypothetical protein